MDLDVWVLNALLLRAVDRAVSPERADMVSDVNPKASTVRVYFIRGR